MSLPRYAARTAGFAVLFLLSAAGGRLTAVDGTPLLWPAAAVAAVWLVAQAPYRLRRFDVIGLAVVAALAPAGGFLAALAGAVPQVVPAVLVAWLLSQRLPGWWAGHGDRFRRPRPTLVTLAAVAAVPAVAGVALSGVLTPGDLGPAEAGYGVLRDTASVFLALLTVRTLRARRLPPSPAVSLPGATRA